LAEQAALKVTVTGRVQGVMFREYTRQTASKLGLDGYVRNLPGGRAVEVEAEGERGRLEEFLILVSRGPPRAEVEKVSPVWSEFSGKYKQFEIRH
jgi:acylphosphatase